MKRIFLLVIIGIMLGYEGTEAQATFKVTALEGTAKIQRSQKKIWENLSLDDQINDNDIIETFFQTKIFLQFGVDNIVILGSNTRTLFNIKEIDEDSGKVSEVNLTLFTGGALVKAVSNSRVSIFSSNAVGQINKGTISTVVESKTSHTGFQILGGTAFIRNIIQQQSKELAQGLTTIVLSGKEPTAPLYITYRHVAVLKHFFGDDYIDRQIQEAGIQPTEDKSETNRLSFSENLQLSKEEAEGQIEKKVFSQNKIWGIILEDQMQKRKIYEPIDKPLRVHTSKGELVFLSTIGLAGGTVYPKFQLLPSFHYPKFSVGFNFPLAKYYDGSMKMGFTSAAGVFDKIHHMTIGSIPDKKYFHLGPIQQYTLGHGLIVNNFQNRNLNTTTQPLGMVLRIKNDMVDVNTFVSDIANWYVGGFHVGVSPGNAILGVGYYYDANQYLRTATSANSRFYDTDSLYKASVKYPDKDSVPSNTHIYELNFGMWYEINEDISFDILCEFARKLAPGGLDGYLIKAPTFGLTMDNISFGANYIFEKGRLLEGHFSSMYMTNRLRYDFNNDTLTCYTQNNQLSAGRKSYGLALFFQMKPFRGTAIDLTFRQDFLTVYPFMDIGSNDAVDSTNSNNNFQFSLSILMNEKLFKPIRYAKIYLTQVHGGFYPKQANYFASWGFNTGFNLLTAPLIFNLSLEAGLDFNYIDIFNSASEAGFPNNNIDQGDNLVEFYLGIRWGYM